MYSVPEYFLSAAHCLFVSLLPIVSAHCLIVTLLLSLSPCLNAAIVSLLLIGQDSMFNF